jgi:hypothetical protein
MLIYFAFQCHNYQRRTCWMLSSILQQDIFPFKIAVDVACMKDNGDPTTEKIVEKFKLKELDISLTVINNRNYFARRGLIRNAQITNAVHKKATHIFFGDADNVYPPTFFKLLMHKLDELGNTGMCVYSANKIHTHVSDTNMLMRKNLGEYPIIKNAFERASQLPVFTIPRYLLKNGAAAGCMQVVTIDDVMKNCNGIYSDRIINDKDMFIHGQLARSDHAFRKRMGGSLKISLPAYIHLGHIRDKELGYHTEEQR